MKFVATAVGLLLVAGGAGSYVFLNCESRGSCSSMEGCSESSAPVGLNAAAAPAGSASTPVAATPASLPAGHPATSLDAAPSCCPSSQPAEQVATPVAMPAEGCGTKTDCGTQTTECGTKTDCGTEAPVAAKEDDCGGCCPTEKAEEAAVPAKIEK